MWVDLTHFNDWRYRIILVLINFNDLFTYPLFFANFSPSLPISETYPHGIRYLVEALAEHAPRSIGAV
jgi:hypothetical protein